jgi:hypothetical protein
MEIWLSKGLKTKTNRSFHKTKTKLIGNATAELLSSSVITAGNESTFKTNTALSFSESQDNN